MNGSNINNIINNFNNKFAGQPTPAGQALINAGLITQSQLVSLGGVMPTIFNAPVGQADNGWLHDLDFTLNWTYKVAERVNLQPGISFFNIANFANFDAAKNTLSGLVAEAPQPGFPGTGVVPGSVNTTQGVQPASLRVGLGSGVFGVGSPRVLELSLKLNF